MWLREAFFKILEIYKKLTDSLILVCHVKDSMINKEGKEMSEMSLDLSGKIGRLVAADADAVGYMYREKNQGILDFSGGSDFIAEARAHHLCGKRITITEKQEDGTIKANWHKIYLPKINN